MERRRKVSKSKRGGLDPAEAHEQGIGSGVLRARDIANGKRINAYQVKAFFDRHKKNYIEARIKGKKWEDSKAWQAWDLWGGEPRRKQVEAAVAKDKRERAKKNPTKRDVEIVENPENVTLENPAQPLDPILYRKVVREAKVKFDVWPSIYASSWVVQEYKRRGGRYRGTGQGLPKWYGEKWVDLSRPKKGGGWHQCGRTQAGSAAYPKCVPEAKARRMSKKQIESAVRRKRQVQRKVAKGSKPKGRAPARVATFTSKRKALDPSLKKARAAWERYYFTYNTRSLRTAYKHLSEAKSSKDKETRKEAREGLKQVRAEAKSRSIKLDA